MAQLGPWPPIGPYRSLSCPTLPTHNHLSLSLASLSFLSTSFPLHFPLLICPLPLHLLLFQSLLLLFLSFSRFTSSGTWWPEFLHSHSAFASIFKGIRWQLFLFYFILTGSIMLRNLCYVVLCMFKNVHVHVIVLIFFTETKSSLFSLPLHNPSSKEHPDYFCASISAERVTS